MPNRSLVSLNTNTNNELLLKNKRGDIISTIPICNIVKNCETVTTLTVNELLNTITYTNEDGVITTINLSNLVENITPPIPPFCVTNLPVVGNPGVLPSPTVTTYGCEGDTIVTTVLKAYSSEFVFTSYTINTPVNLSFICGIGAIKCEIATTVTNDCGTYTDIKLLPTILHNNEVRGYCGEYCCKATITDISVLTDQTVSTILGNTTLLKPVYYLLNVNKNVTIYGTPFALTKDMDEVSTAVSITYDAGITNGYTTLNYNGVLIDPISNNLYNTYLNTDGIGTLGTNNSAITMNVTQTLEDNVDVVCGGNSVFVTRVPVEIPAAIITPSYVSVNLFNLVVLPPHTPPIFLDFIYNRIIDGIIYDRSTGIVQIPYSTPDWANALGYFTISTVDPITDKKQILSVVVIVGQEPI